MVDNNVSVLYCSSRHVQLADGINSAAARGRHWLPLSFDLADGQSAEQYTGHQQSTVLEGHHTAAYTAHHSGTSIYPAFSYESKTLVLVLYDESV